MATQEIYATTIIFTATPLSVTQTSTSSRPTFTGFPGPIPTGFPSSRCGRSRNQTGLPIPRFAELMVGILIGISATLLLLGVIVLIRCLKARRQKQKRSRMTTEKECLEEQDEEIGAKQVILDDEEICGMRTESTDAEARELSGDRSPLELNGEGIPEENDISEMAGGSIKLEINSGRKALEVLKQD
ncbi:hypothetical protein GLAREA_01341 [Glarea lozoyensis ATCC 20868]|uniref:Uncharacterized protein n=1 Tax=Glarea lozoyensis (strain ATCC 20868 / MF5171) TaxID=1116229 RepID=S3CJM5_GLAL2|nr:uncharacterized protein GLAREA_01341 [Glarea lozoyensis ATCC 20868]EPE25429.1 hypothetical protein GLAREA_01341 [Glarea lozoyensis ATCC 20868]